MKSTFILILVCLTAFTQAKFDSLEEVNFVQINLILPDQ